MKRRVALVGLMASMLVACAPMGGGQALVAPVEGVGVVEQAMQAVALEVAAAAGARTQAGARPEAVLPQTPPESCAATLAPETPFTPPAPWPATAPYPGQFWYGSEDLWIALPADGTWSQLARGGDKVFWWRAGYVGPEEPQPALSMTARRLDGDAPVVDVPARATNAYHPDFEWAMLAGLGVPTAGCWEVTGHYGGTSLSFVVWVAP